MISKQILERVNHHLKIMLNATLWRNSAEVIEWCMSIQKKECCTFVNFYIMEFHPSISPVLLEKAISWVYKLVVIRQDETKSISNA